MVSHACNPSNPELGAEGLKV
ncbi:rCG30795 [Rattus norvegicus]|uniref:RCG30795 n=1 Tax=Rattus norvegicus TaxID=10116 RepID=A6IUE0_RAT|nr:rCG30795 [Rattus norvegicus]